MNKSADILVNGKLIHIENIMSVYEYLTKLFKEYKDELEPSVFKERLKFINDYVVKGLFIGFSVIEDRSYWFTAYIIDENMNVIAKHVFR